jgi:hypothetical protein
MRFEPSSCGLVAPPCANDALAAPKRNAAASISTAVLATILDFKLSLRFDFLDLERITA